MQSIGLFQLALSTEGTAAYRFARNKLFDRYLLGIVRRFIGYVSEVYPIESDERLVFDKKNSLFSRVSTRKNEARYDITHFRTCEKKPHVYTVRPSSAHAFGDNGVCYSINGCAILQHKPSHNSLFSTLVYTNLVVYITLLKISRNYIFAIRGFTADTAQVIQCDFTGRHIDTFLIKHAVDTIVDFADTEVYVRDMATSTVRVVDFKDILRRKYPLPNDAQTICTHADGRHILAAGAYDVYLIDVNGVVAKKRHTNFLVYVPQYQIYCGSVGDVYVTRQLTDGQKRISITNVGKLKV